MAKIRTPWVLIILDDTRAALQPEELAALEPRKEAWIKKLQAERVFPREIPFRLLRRMMAG